MSISTYYTGNDSSSSIGLAYGNDGYLYISSSFSVSSPKFIKKIDSNQNVTLFNNTINYNSKLIFDNIGFNNSPPNGYLYVLDSNNINTLYKIDINNGI